MSCSKESKDASLFAFKFRNYHTWEFGLGDEFKYFFFFSLSNGKRTRQEGKAKTVKCQLIAGAADSRGG